MKTRFSVFSWALGCLLLVGLLPAAQPTAAPALDLIPAKVHQRVKVQFPVRPFHEGIVKGEASLMLEVHPDGQLGDVLPFAHSGVDFAVAAIEAAKQWAFTPARIGGEPVRSILTINVHFEVNGVTAYTKLIGQDREKSASNNVQNFRPFSLAELDRVPAAVSRPRPVYLDEWKEQGKTGSVVVDFFIDTNGNTRFARLIGNPDEMLGAAVVTAVKAWKFEPPTSGGRPVLAEVRQVIHFRPDQSSAPP